MVVVSKISHCCQEPLRPDAVQVAVHVDALHDQAFGICSAEIRSYRCQEYHSTTKTPAPLSFCGVDLFLPPITHGREE